MRSTDCLSSIKPINSIIVEVAKASEEMTESGLYIPNVEEKAVNYGRVVALPFLITKEYESFAELVSNLSLGDVVFFNPKFTYNSIKTNCSKLPNVEYLLIQIDNIHAISKVNRE